MRDKWRIGAAKQRFPEATLGPRPGAGAPAAPPLY